MFAISLIGNSLRKGAFLPKTVSVEPAVSPVEPDKCLELFEQRWGQIEFYREFASTWGAPANNYAGLQSQVVCGESAVPEVFDHSITSGAKFLSIGTFFKTIDNDGNRILVIGTRAGPVVVFEDPEHPCEFHAGGYYGLYEALGALPMDRITRAEDLARIIGANEEGENIASFLESAY